MKAAVPFCLLGFLLFPAAAGAQSHIGIMLSGYEEGCEITHNGKVHDCDTRRQIYLGDVIRKKPSTKTLKIKWAPYVKGVPRGETLVEAAVDRPEALKGSSYAGTAKQYLEDFVKPAEYSVTSAVTRDPRYRYGLPDRATLIQGYPMLIAREGREITSLSISTGDGKGIVERPVKGDGFIVLDLELLPLMPGQTYLVRLRGDGVSRRFTANTLPKNVQEEVLQGLSAIDGEKLPGAEALVRKAAYLEMISDLYSETLDLYWLSFQLLRDSSHTLTKEQQAAFEALRERYYSHKATKE